MMAALAMKFKKMLNNTFEILFNCISYMLHLKVPPEAVAPIWSEAKEIQMHFVKSFSIRGVALPKLQN